MIHGIEQEIAGIARSHYTSPSELKVFDLGSKKIIGVSDVEGPLVLGDANVSFLQSLIPHYAEKYLTEQNKWFSDHVKGFRHIQRGTDIIFSLPLYIARGVTDEQMETFIWDHHKLTPGAQQLVAHVNNDGGAVAGITTAVEKAHIPIGQELELTVLAGTHLPLNQTRSVLEGSGKLEEEVTLVERYLIDCFHIIDSIKGETDFNQREYLEQQLQDRIGTFLTKDLGLIFDKKTREQNGPPHTVLGKMIDVLMSNGLIGYRGKATFAKAIGKEAPQAFRYGVGDGTVDGHLAQRYKTRRSLDLTIATNAVSRAIEEADIAVVTEDMSSLIPILDMARVMKKQNGHVDIVSLVERARAVVRGGTIVEFGGENPPQKVVDAHTDMRRTLSTVVTF